MFWGQEIKPNVNWILKQRLHATKTKSQRSSFPFEKRMKEAKNYGVEASAAVAIWAPMGQNLDRMPPACSREVRPRFLWWRRQFLARQNLREKNAEGLVGIQDTALFTYSNLLPFPPLALRSFAPGRVGPSQPCGCSRANSGQDKMQLAESWRLPFDIEIFSS